MDSPYAEQERPRLADDPLVSQLRTELKARGYVGLVMHRDDLSLYLMWFLGVLLGLTLASGRN